MFHISISGLYLSCINCNWFAAIHLPDKRELVNFFIFVSLQPSDYRIRSYNAANFAQKWTKVRYTARLRRITLQWSRSRPVIHKATAQCNANVIKERNKIASLVWENWGSSTELHKNYKTTETRSRPPDTAYRYYSNRKKYALPNSNPKPTLLKYLKATKLNKL